MSCITHKESITNIYNNVSNMSFKEKKEAPLNEEIINRFLDGLNSFKSRLAHKTNLLNEIISDCETLTWIDEEFDDDILKRINDLISTIRDLRSTLIRQYISMNTFRRKGVFKKEIQDFKNAIDDLRDIADDFETIFFFLPELPEFRETTIELSLI